MNKFTNTFFKPECSNPGLRKEKEAGRYVEQETGGNDSKKMISKHLLFQKLPLPFSSQKNTSHVFPIP